MSRIYLYTTDLLIIISLFTGNIYGQAQENEEEPDSVTIPLNIRAGIEVIGPAIYFINRNILNSEGYISADINEKMALSLNAGYSDYKYSQYNYEYYSKGIFVRAGVDLNILKPEVSRGKYWAGVGIRYSVSMFNSATPSFTHENYWGTTTSSIESVRRWGHFIELLPGFRAELFKNFSIGWSINLRKLIYSGRGRDISPLYFPGYGGGGGTVSAGISYFMSWNIPFKKIQVAIKQEQPEVSPDEEEIPDTGADTGSQSLGGRNLSPRFR